MTNLLLDTRIAGVPFLLGLYSVSGIAVIVLALSLRRMGRRRVGVTLGGILAGTVLGWVATWLVCDVWDLIGLSADLVTRLWVCAFGAAVVLAGFSLVRTRWRMRLLAAVALPLVLLTAAAGVNAQVGQFDTLRTALGLGLIDPLSAAGPGLPGSERGSVGTVTIPAPESGFAARTAVVYLPAAARRARPPALPVLEMMSGQPGGPADLFTSGRFGEILDAFAAAHHGLAPIVVVPDQLGAADRNPMCVDSGLGNSATYLTRDVPNWIRSHFTVAAAPGGWAIGGFSQGGTCSIQLGAAHPDLFGTILDISGELTPHAGTPQQTVATGFGGSWAAYAAAAPTALLAAHAPYQSLHAIFAVGSNDARYRSWMTTVSAAATAAGVTSHVIVSPGTAHDWHTVVYALTKALPLLADRLGLAGTR